MNIALVGGSGLVVCGGAPLLNHNGSSPLVRKPNLSTIRSMVKCVKNSNRFQLSSQATLGGGSDQQLIAAVSKSANHPGHGRVPTPFFESIRGKGGGVEFLSFENIPLI